MTMYNKNNTDVLVKNEPGRTASNTVRKFTGKIGEEPPPQSVSVALDWLSFMVQCWLPEPAPDAGPVWLTDNVVLIYQKKGTPVFNYSYEILVGGEPVAKCHTHSKNPKIIKEGTAKLEINNHVLYATGLNDLMIEIMAACKMPAINNTSGLHIAIDGVEHIHAFLNAYARQPNPAKKKDIDNGTAFRWDKKNRVKMKGKASFDAKRFNRKTGMFEAFKVGGARKSLVVYNKTSELERSHKEYIRQSWERAGIDTTGTVWRCELRLTSQTIKEIKNFDLSQISDPNYLLQIVRTQLKNFFEFILVEGDGNVSRARVIDLFQFEKLKVPLLEKIPRAVTAGAYKAQMSIHNGYMNVVTNKFKTEVEIKAAIQHINDNVNLYGLQRWYDRKQQEWNILYLAPHQYAPATEYPQLR